MIPKPWCKHRRRDVWIFLSLLFHQCNVVTAVARENHDRRPQQRHLRSGSGYKVAVQSERTQRNPYYRTNNTEVLGVPNTMAAIGNPLKGLAPFGSRNPNSSSSSLNMKASLEFYNIGLDDVMIGDNQFDWTTHDTLLQYSASRNRHAVLSVFIHWPGETLRIPPHLIDIPFYPTNNGYSPNYGEPRLLTALQQFIAAWGKHVDGDKRVAAIHIGLLGFWGEGHTFPDTTLVPETSKQLVAGWYREAFNQTQIQARYPGPNADDFGLFDASLGYSTLDGDANGGVSVDWFMYPQIVEANQQNTWINNMIGGETRPELQSIIFTDTYPARTENHQDIKECIDTLHVSYVLHHGAFQDSGYTGTTLERANIIHAAMGYAFHVSEVSAFPVTTNDNSINDTIDISVQIVQAGVAPFYYDLSLQLSCNDGAVVMTVDGVEQIIVQGESSHFEIRNIPATTKCLNQITLSLHSSYAYSTHPVRFAQGQSDGTNITLSIPLPPMIQKSTNAPATTPDLPSENPPTVTIIESPPTLSPTSTLLLTELNIRQLIAFVCDFAYNVRQHWKAMKFN